MSDTLTNALQQSAHNSTVLQGIMNPAQVNPLAGMGSAISAVSGMQGLAESNAKRAAGQAFLNSIDPATGQPNQSLLLQNLQKDPSTAYAAQSSAASGQALDTSTYNLHMTRLGNVANEMGQLIADYPHGVPQEAANAAIDRAVQAGHFTPADAAVARSHLSADPVNNSQVITQGLFRNLSAQQALNAAKPAVGTLDTGQSTTGTATTPQGSTTGQPGAIAPVGQPITTGLPSRTTLGAQTKWQDNQGIEHNTTWEEYVAARNSGLTTRDPLLVGGQPYQPGAPGAARPPPPPPVGTNVARPGAAAATQPPAPQPRFSDTTGPAPGMQEKWKASADQYNADNAAAGSYQQRIFPLVQAASILKSGDVTTGQGAEAVNRVKSFLMTQATNLGIDAQTIQQADFDKVGKYLQQYVNQQGMSGRSDQALASAVSGNPSAHISTLANQQILPAMLGMERMRQAIITDFKAQGGQPNQYSDYAADWQNKHDPRAFIFDQLDNDQRQKIAASLKTPAARKAFSDTLDIVERNPGIMGQAVMPGH